MEITFTIGSCGLTAAALVIGLLVRSLAESQPESPGSTKTRARLTGTGYSLMGIALLVPFAALLMGIGPAAFVFLLTGVMLFLFFEAELQYQGTRRRVQEAELLWVLATAVKSGRPLADEIEAYARGTWGKRYKRLVELADRLRSGVPLTELSVPQGLLPRSATVDLHAGVAAGKLEQALIDSALRHTRQLSDDNNTSVTHGTLTYPLAVVWITAMIIGFISYWIMPKFKKIFDDFGTELPGFTIFMIGSSNTAMNYWYVAGPLLWTLPIVVFATAYANYVGWRVAWKRLFGLWFVRPHAPDVLRSLARVIDVEAPALEALRPFLSSQEPACLKNRITRVRNAITNGEDCFLALAEQGVITGQEAKLLLLAEQTKTLGWTLNSLADAIERRWFFRLQAGLQLLQPILILLLGIVVGVMALACFLPLVKLLNDLS